MVYLGDGSIQSRLRSRTLGSKQTIHAEELEDVRGGHWSRGNVATVDASGTRQLFPRAPAHGDLISPGITNAEEDVSGVFT